MKLYKIKFGDNKILAREWGQSPFTVIDGYFEDEMDGAGEARWKTIFAREEIAYYLSHRDVVLAIDDEFVQNFIEVFGVEVEE